MTLAIPQSPRLQKYLALGIHYQFLTGRPTSSCVTLGGQRSSCFMFLTARSSLGRLKMLSVLIAASFFLLLSFPFETEVKEVLVI